MTTLELQTKLDSFGTFHNFTDYRSIGDCLLEISPGCKYLLDYTDIQWLYDIIYNFLHDSKHEPAVHLIWDLKKEHNGLFTLTAKTLRGRLLFEQYEIDQKFPLDRLILYYCWFMMILPTERVYGF